MNTIKVGQLAEGRWLTNDLPSPEDLSAAAASTGENLTLVELIDPAPDVVASVARTLGLHPMLTEDLVAGHQRPKIEAYPNSLYCVLSVAHYEEQLEDVRVSEVHLVITEHLVVCLIKSRDNSPQTMQAWINELKGRLAEQSHLLQIGQSALLYSIIDFAVDGYLPVIRILEEDVEEVESDAFTGKPTVTERIYRLSHEVIDLQHCVQPIQQAVAALPANEDSDNALHFRAYVTDLLDHLTRDLEAVMWLRDSLARILDVNATLVAQRQNDDMRKISAWAAILFTPSIIGSIYGMNFAHMPELHQTWGYPAALALMLASAGALWLTFKTKGWF